MGRKATPGLILRGEVWHIDKQHRGQRICQSTGTCDLQEAEEILARLIDQNRQAAYFGVRPDRTFRQAAIKYLTEADKKSVDRDAQSLKLLEPFIGDLPLRKVHDETLRPFIQARRKAGIKSSTINRDLAVVRRILNLAGRKWRDENDLTWIEAPPLVEMLRLTDARKPYPLDWAEQELFFSELAPHLRSMALFMVNSGLRDQELCGLLWEWETKIPELGVSVFVIPGAAHKNHHDRLVVLNRMAMSVLEEQRGKHPGLVFPFRGKRLHEMLNTGWKKARARAAERYEQELGKPCPTGFASLRVHDLKHTWGRRLRAMGVSHEDRQDLLGHHNGNVTTHYSVAEIGNLLEATNKVCGSDSRKTPALVLLRA